MTSVLFLQGCHSVWENLLNLLFSWRVSGESWALRVLEIHVQSLLYGSEYNRLTSEDNIQLTARCSSTLRTTKHSYSSESVFCSISPHSSHVCVSLPLQIHEGTNTDASSAVPRTATYQTLLCTPSQPALRLGCWCSSLFQSKAGAYKLMKKLAAT